MVTFFRTPSSKTSHEIRENVNTLPVNTFRISDFSYDSFSVEINSSDSEVNTLNSSLYTCKYKTSSPKNNKSMTPMFFFIKSF